MTKEYVTTDLYLTAYLKTKGDDYLNETGSCEPLAFTNAIKNIKNILFNKR